MKKKYLYIALSSLLLCSCSKSIKSDNTTINTPSPTQIVEITQSPSPTATKAPTSTPGPTATPSPTLAPTSTPSPTPAPTTTPIPTPKPTATPIPVAEEDFSEWIPYSTSDEATLIQLILEGTVIYYNDQYYCSPEYAQMISNEVIVYENDISEGESDVEYEDRYSLSDFEIEFEEDTNTDIDGN